MKNAQSPRQILEALTGQGDLTTLSFAAVDLDRARALARAPGEAKAEEVEALPEPLALAVLEAAVRTQALALAEALTLSQQKPLAKAAKKALYQLRSMGLVVPERKPSAPVRSDPAPSAEAPLPSLVSAITGNGERALIIGRPLQGRVETLQLVLADEHGVVHLGINVISRGQYRKLLRDASQQKTASAVEVPLEEAKALLGDAVGWNLRTKTPFPAGLETALRHLGVSPAEAPFSVPPPEEDDPGLAARGAGLHAEPELAQWLPAVEALRAFAVAAQEIARSPLYVDEDQRAEQLRRTVLTSAEAYFTDDVARLYGRRLWRMADLFDRTGRGEAASVARAEARRLFHRAQHRASGDVSPFGAALFEKVLSLSASAQAQGAGEGANLPAPGALSAPRGPAEEAAAGSPQAKPETSPGGIILP